VIDDELDVCDCPGLLGLARAATRAVVAEPIRARSKRPLDAQTRVRAVVTRVVVK
jgi:hypothetical protein